MSITPPVSEVLSKPELRVFNLDNTFNKEGVMAHYVEDEDVMTYCAETKKPLFFTNKSGQQLLLNSFGFCVVNGKPYSAECLRMTSHVAISPFPLEYIGYHSQEEYDKPLSEEDLSELRKTYHI